ncbi:transcription factor IBH1-like 1 [Triticum dicoccoides]|uniref:transcription factor IBH1-like 1 n=1 Tax=Triticum dicoccoides TaxID=85692 RepID=UPI000E79C971|nr:transcription factor IBH1-like 1 [Triticum dicoccoides]
MKDPNTSTMSFKQAFLKNLLLGLQLQAHTRTSFGNGAMSLHERKRAVKSSVDVAMAAAHGGGARWPKAILVPASSACKVQRCRRTVRRCCRRKRCSGRSGRAGGGDTPGRLVSSRTMALREVIPGGRNSTVDEATLLREAMDYAVHLRSQVDVLRRLSEAVQTSSSSDSDRALRMQP